MRVIMSSIVSSCCMDVILLYLILPSDIHGAMCKIQCVQHFQQYKSSGPMDYLFPEKNAPLILSRQLRQLIETIGETKTKEQEESIIKKEIAVVKEQLQSEVDPNDYPDIMVKLIYFETLGYNSSFARILPIKLCQSPSPYLKKISYLLSAMLVKPGQKIAILMHNTIIKDLESDNVFTNLTVLTMLRYFINEDIGSDILGLLRKMLKHKMSMIRRKTLFVFFNIYQLYPHLVDDMRDIAMTAFADPETPVVFAAVNVLKFMIDADHTGFKAQTARFVEIFQKIVDHKYPPQYDYHKVPAPWMQIELLTILEKLGKNDASTSKLMYDALDKCMRRSQNIYMHFNKGILQQCIRTIANIYPHDYLLNQSAKSLYSFFDESNSNNIKSFGLTAMKYLAKVRPETIENWQMFLIECLDSPDMTLAERTIVLLIEIANESNVEIILNRIITLAEKSTDSAEKRKLIKSSIYLIERFSNDKEIFLRRMNEIFYKFEQFVTETSINNFLKALQQMVELDPQFVDMLVKTYIQIIENFRNSPLVKVSVWILGEMTHKIYLRDKNSQAVDRSIEAILSCADEYLSNNFIIFTIVSSLMKLSSLQMTSKHEEIKAFLLKVQAQPLYFIHKCGQQFIRMAKYGKALYGANELEFDPKMKFLHNYVSKHYEMNNNEKKSYLVTKKKSEKAQINDIDMMPNELVKKDSGTTNIFEFKPGQRWGLPKQPTVKPTTQTVQQPRKQSIGQGKMILRGPHQQKKTKSVVDEKKMKLAKSIFGKNT